MRTIRASQWVAAACVGAWLGAGPLPVRAQTDAVITARGTGRTTGHIADLTVANPTPRPFDVKIEPAYIPSGGQYQSYVMPAAIRQTVAPQDTVRIPVVGYCVDVRRPPVPAGADMPPLQDWVPAGELPGLGALVVSDAGPYRPRTPGARTTLPVATLPGSDRPLPFVVDPDAHPHLAAPILVSGIQSIEAAYDRLAKAGTLSTPFSANPEKERESVIQQTFWIFAASLKGEAYGREEFAERMQAQLEESTGKSLAVAPPPVQQRFEQGVDDFWNTFTLVGVEAKVLSAVKTDQP